MQPYNVIYDSRTIDLDKFELQKELSYRPQTDEYIVAIDKKNRSQKFLKIIKIGHLYKDGVPYLFLILQL